MVHWRWWLMHLLTIWRRLSLISSVTTRWTCTRTRTRTWAWTSSHHWGRSTVLWNCIESLMLLRWWTLPLIHTSTTTHLIILVSISLVCQWFLLIFISLRSVVHFYGSPQNCFSLHFLKSAFRFFFGTKLDKAISFWYPCYWVANDFGLIDTRENLFESLHEKDVVDTWLKIAYVDLVTFCWTGVTLLWLALVLVLVLVHVRLSLTSMHLRLRLSSGSSSSYSSTVRSPVKFEILVWSRYLLPVKRQENISGSLPIWEFNESITHRSSSFVPDEFDIGNSCDLIELSSDVLLIHPRLHVTYPQGFRLLRYRGITTLIFRTTARLLLRWLLTIHSVHFMWVLKGYNKL